MIYAPPACHHDSAICVSREFFMWRPGCHCLPLRYSVTCLIRSTRIPFTLVKTLYVWIADIVKKKQKQNIHFKSFTSHPLSRRSCFPFSVKKTLNAAPVWFSGITPCPVISPEWCDHWVVSGTCGTVFLSHRCLLPRCVRGSCCNTRAGWLSGGRSNNC